MPLDLGALQRRLGYELPTPDLQTMEAGPNNPTPPDPFAGLSGLGNLFGNIGTGLGNIMQGAQNAPVLGGALQGLGALYGQTVDPAMGLIEKVAGSPAAQQGFYNNYQTLQGDVPNPADIFALTRGLRGAHSAASAEASATAADTTRSPVERALAGLESGADTAASNLLPIPGVGEIGGLLGRSGRAASRVAAEAEPDWLAGASRLGDAPTGTGRTIENLMGVPRTIATSAAPFHGMFRHGLAFAAAHPVEWLGGWAEGGRALFSDPAETTAHYATLRDAVDANGGERLYLSQPEHGIAGGEEAVASNILNHVPLLGNLIQHSSQAFVASLNEVRAATFNNLIEAYEKNGAPLDQAAKDSLADTINHFSGRGFTTTGPSAIALARGLNSVFFAPQLTVSRARMFGDAINGFGTLSKNLLTGEALDPVALERVRLTGGYFAGLGAIYAMASQFGLTADTNPISALFGKIDLGPATELSRNVAEFGDQIGWTTQDINGHIWLDPTANEGPLFRTAARVLTGHETSASGKTQKLNATTATGKPVFGAPTYFDILMNFAESKLSPILYQAVQVLQGRPSDISSLFLPIAIHSYLTQKPANTGQEGSNAGTPFVIHHPQGRFTITHPGSTPITPAQPGFQIRHPTSGGNVQATIASVATDKGVDPKLVLAIAQVESGFNPMAIGDNGNSHGLFQENIYGRGAGRAPDYDVRNQTERVSNEIAALERTGYTGTPGDIAAAVQRPADPGRYAQMINAIYYGQ